MMDAEKLNELAEPLMEYLTENCHPHSAVVVTADRAAVVEVALSIPREHTEDGWGK